jgi:hypothetical protein
MRYAVTAPDQRQQMQFGQLKRRGYLRADRNEWIAQDAINTGE